MCFLLFLWFSLYIILECLRCIQSCTPTPTNSLICKLQPGFWCCYQRTSLCFAIASVSWMFFFSDLELCKSQTKPWTIFVCNLWFKKTLPLRRSTVPLFKGFFLRPSIIGFLTGGGLVIPLIFPKVPQSSQTESLGFPNHPQRLLQACTHRSNHPGRSRAGLRRDASVRLDNVTHLGWN